MKEFKSRFAFHFWYRVSGTSFGAQVVRWTITLDPDNTRDTSEEALLNDLFEDYVERLNKMIRSSKG